MSVSDGEKGNAANFNSSFLSRETDSNTVAIIGLDNIDPDSGDSIVNTQKEINRASKIVYPNENIISNGIVAIDLLIGEQIRIVSGSGGAQTANLVPFGTTAPEDGTIINLIGDSDSETITFSNNNAAKGMLIFGAATLKRGYMFSVVYIAAHDRYYEIGRNF